MEGRPKALLLKFPGTNCDAETSRALRIVGFDTDIIPIARVTPENLEGVGLVVLSGGFSYGDYVMAGRLAALETQRRLGDTLKDFVKNGGFAIGICNGFQILTQLGLLPKGSLIDNTSGRFQCRWVTMKNLAPSSPYLKDLPDEFELPIAHAEGRFVTLDEASEDYFSTGNVALTYTSDVNGSEQQIAGIHGHGGRVLGLMPHPERFLYRRHHYDPDWDGDPEWGCGYYIFKCVYESVSAANLVA